MGAEGHSNKQMGVCACVCGCVRVLRGIPYPSPPRKTVARSATSCIASSSGAWGAAAGTAAYFLPPPWPPSKDDGSTPSGVTPPLLPSSCARTTSTEASTCVESEPPLGVERVLALARSARASEAF